MRLQFALISWPGTVVKHSGLFLTFLIPFERLPNDGDMHRPNTRVKTWPARNTDYFSERRNEDTGLLVVQAGTFRKQISHCIWVGGKVKHYTAFWNSRLAQSVSGLRDQITARRQTNRHNYRLSFVNPRKDHRTSHKSQNSQKVNLLYDRLRHVSSNLQCVALSMEELYLYNKTNTWITA